MHSTEDNFTTEGTIRRTWNSRIHPFRQWTSVCQSLVQGICWRMELRSSHKFTHKPKKQWTSWICSEDCQRTTHQSQVFRRRPLPCTSILLKKFSHINLLFCSRFYVYKTTGHGRLLLIAIIKTMGWWHLTSVVFRVTNMHLNPHCQELYSTLYSNVTPSQIYIQM